MKEFFTWSTFRTVVLLLTILFLGEPSPRGVAAEADTLKVAYFDSPEMLDGAPAGWTRERYRGEPDLTMERDAVGVFLRMASRGDRAFGIRKKISVDLATYPFLNWRWRVHKLPARGDVRRADRDDQAAQIYVVYKKAGMHMTLQSPTVAYVWDNEAPRGLTVKSPQRLMGNVRYVVMRDGTDAIGQWHTERRNLLEDGRNAFPELHKESFPQQVQGMMLFINTHHTNSEAAGDVGDLSFSRR